MPVGADVIKWNAHRKYGRLRLPVLLHGWTLVAQAGLTAQLLDDTNPDTHIQPVLVLKNNGGGVLAEIGDKVEPGQARSGRRWVGEVQSQGEVPVTRTRLAAQAWLLIVLIMPKRLTAVCHIREASLLAGSLDWDSILNSK